jgi:hypothetical protein
LNRRIGARLLAIGSYAFIGLSALVLLLGIYLYVSLGSFAEGLPIRTVNQYRNLTDMIPLLATLESDLEGIRAGAKGEDRSELRFTVNKINSSRRLIASVFDRTIPPDLAALLSEISALASDLSRDDNNAAPMSATDAILYRNRAGYIYSEFRDYLVRINNDTLLALEGQARGVGSLKTAMLLSLSIVFLAVLLTFFFLRREKRLLARLEQIDVHTTEGQLKKRIHRGVAEDAEKR